MRDLAVACVLADGRRAVLREERADPRRHRSELSDAPRELEVVGDDEHAPGLVRVAHRVDDRVVGLAVQREHHADAAGLARGELAGRRMAVEEDRRAGAKEAHALADVADERAAIGLVIACVDAEHVERVVPVDEDDHRSHSNGGERRPSVRRT